MGNILLCQIKVNFALLCSLGWWIDGRRSKTKSLGTKKEGRRRRGKSFGGVLFLSPLPFPIPKCLVKVRSPTEILGPPQKRMDDFFKLRLFSSHPEGKAEVVGEKRRVFRTFLKQRCDNSPPFQPL